MTYPAILALHWSHALLRMTGAIAVFGTAYGVLRVVRDAVGAS